MKCENNKNIFVEPNSLTLAFMTLFISGILNRSLIVVSSKNSLKAMGFLKRIFFMVEYLKMTEILDISLRDFKGLWYEINRETLDVTQQFFDQEKQLQNIIVNIFNKFFLTEKIEAFFKKKISFEVTSVLEKLHYIANKDLLKRTIMLKKCSLNKLIVEYFEKKYSVSINVKYQIDCAEFLGLTSYYCWFLGSVFCRGFVFNAKKKKYKVLKEVISGFSDEAFSDDALIDGDLFREKDVLFVNFNSKEEMYIKHSEDALTKGYDVINLKELKLNVNNTIYSLLFQYLSGPFFVFHYLLVKRKLYLFGNVFLLLREAFVFEVLMNLFEVRCFFSSADYGDVVPSIVFNKYGAKSIISHWSDMTAFKDFKLAFIVHNIYFAWGDIHYDFHSDNLYVDEKVNVGCIYKKQYNELLKNKNVIIDKLPQFDRNKKTVVFFDSSFSSLAQMSDSAFLEYLYVINEYCRMNKDVNIIYRPKGSIDVVSFCCRNFLHEYLELRKKLSSYENLYFFERQEWSTMEAIILSDVVVSFGMNSPATITLILGKEALYFNNTGNTEHPFAKAYTNQLVFESCDMLIEQINKILDYQFSCRSVLTEKDIRNYDAFDDDLAFDRIREYLYNMCS